MTLPRLFSLTTILFLLFGLGELAQAYYNPETGSFLSRDPIEERGGENLYGFVRNSSIDHIDVLGQSYFLASGGPQYVASDGRIWIGVVACGEHEDKVSIRGGSPRSVYKDGELMNCCSGYQITSDEDYFVVTIIIEGEGEITVGMIADNDYGNEDGGSYETAGLDIIPIRMLHLTQNPNPRGIMQHSHDVFAD